MNIISPTSYIRQQQFGQFRRAEDGIGPYVRVNNQKLESTRDQDERSIYVDNEKFVTFEKDVTESDAAKLFDTGAGLQPYSNIEMTDEKKEKPLVQYDKTGKELTVTNKQVSSVDLWV